MTNEVEGIGASARPARRGVLAAVAAAAVLALTLGAPGGAAAAEEGKLRLMLPSPPTTWILPFYMAQDSGWFAQQGLTVEEIYVQGDATAFRGLVADNCDVTAIGPATIFAAILGGAEVAAIGSWQPIVDYQIVAKKGLATSLGDLTGRTFASSGPSDLTTEIPKMVLRKNGVDDTTVKFVQVGGHGPRLQAIAAGVVEATMINTLTATKGQLDGTVDVIASVTEHFPDLGYTLLAVRKDDLADPVMRKNIAIFMEGSILGARMILDDPEGAAKVLHARVPDLDEELIVNTLKALNEQGVWGNNGAFPESVAIYSAESAQELGLVAESVAPARYLDNTVAEEILVRVGKQ